MVNKTQNRKTNSIKNTNRGGNPSYVGFPTGKTNDHIIKVMIKIIFFIFAPPIYMTILSGDFL